MCSKVLDFTSEFLTTSFEHRLPRLSHRHFMFKFMGWVSDNCFTESENSAIARDTFGPKPSHKLHISADTTLQHTDERFRKIVSDAMTAYHSRKTEAPNETEREFVARALSQYLNDAANDQVMNQYDLSIDYYGIEATSREMPNTKTFLFRHHPTVVSSPNHRRPVYARTRTVVVREVLVDDEHFVCLQCSCGHFFQYLGCCRHIYCLLDRYPIEDDVFPECFKSYDVFYGEDGSEEYTTRCDARTELLEHHKGMLLVN